mmetsp:Transcript_35430/g.105925  ORF Transcript_35430/g.105925 Transcript_35430/m.105925 type:complete len:206 (+) Transcript_35430:325-942(+)
MTSNVQSPMQTGEQCLVRHARQIAAVQGGARTGGAGQRSFQARRSERVQHLIVRPRCKCTHRAPRVVELEYGQLHLIESRLNRREAALDRRGGAALCREARAVLAFEPLEQVTHHAADACQPLLGACLLARVSFVRLPPSASANGRSIGDSNPDGLARRQLPCIPLKGSNLRPRRLRLCALPLPELLERGDLRLALEILVDDELE